MNPTISNKKKKKTNVYDLCWNVKTSMNEILFAYDDFNFVWTKKKKMMDFATIKTWLAFIYFVNKDNDIFRDCSQIYLVLV